MDSILFKLKAGTTYSKNVRQLKSKIQLNTSGVEVMAFRKMRDEAVYVKLKKGAGDKVAYKSDLEFALSHKVDVRNLTARVTLEVTDLDPTVTPEEVIAGDNKLRRGAS